MTRRRCRRVGGPVGSGSVKPCAARATRRAAASERRSRRAGTTGILAGVLVRDASPGDGRRFEEVRIAGWRAAYRGIIDDRVLDGLVVEDARVEQREAWLAAPPPDEVFLVAEVDGDVVGGAFLLPVRDTDLDDAAELAALYVDPERRYGGIGSALLRSGFDR